MAKRVLPVLGGDEIAAEEVQHWENILRDHRLGMERGRSQRVSKQDRRRRVVYSSDITEATATARNDVRFADPELTRVYREEISRKPAAPVSEPGRGPDK